MPTLNIPRCEMNNFSFEDTNNSFMENNVSIDEEISTSPKTVDNSFFVTEVPIPSPPPKTKPASSHQQSNRRIIMRSVQIEQNKELISQVLLNSNK